MNSARVILIELLYIALFPSLAVSHEKLGPKAKIENLNSVPPASSSLFRNLFGPNSRAFSLSTSSSSSSWPLSNGPFLEPSSSHNLPFADLMKAT